MAKTEKKEQPRVLCAECSLGRPVRFSYGDPPLVQCSHTLLVRVANSPRRCGHFHSKKKGR